MSGHEKAVNCISSEPAGNRIVTGSYDYSIKIYDFGGMDKYYYDCQFVLLDLIYVI